MRLLFILFIFTLSLQATSHSAVEAGYYKNYEQALIVAKAEKKPLMLIVVTSYCPWCRKFERKSLSSSKAKAYIVAHFVAVIVDRNKDAKLFPAIYQTPRIPTVYYIDPQSEKAYWETVGYLNKSDLSEALEDAKILYESKSKEP